MRILLDQAAHDMRNKGNNALLQAAIEQLRSLWPDADFDVVTLAPTLTRLYFPEVGTVHPIDLQPLQTQYDPYLAHAPGSLVWLLFEARESLWHHWPALMPAHFRQMIRLAIPHRRLRARGQAAGGVPLLGPVLHDAAPAKQAMTAAIGRYDLVVAVGGGYLCDVDRPMVLQVFDHLEAAIAQCVPTVMVSQGVGPLENPELQARAQAILPFVDLIFVRERRVAPELLAKLGVPAERVVMTGDDAVEMAFTARPAPAGNGIGVSIRVAPYTAIDEADLAVIGEAIQRAAHKYQSPLVALPISSAPHEADLKHIRHLMAGYSPASFAGRRLASPADTIRETAHCRVVVTGTFHAAVFALAQGIPVVALAKSAEYMTKLTGLADEFGPGCQVLQLGGHDVPTRLAAAIDQAWASADTVGAELLENAVRQIRMQHAAYQRIKTLVLESQRGTAPQTAVRPEAGVTLQLQRT